MCAAATAVLAGLYLEAPAPFQRGALGLPQPSSGGWCKGRAYQHCGVGHLLHLTQQREY